MSYMTVERDLQLERAIQKMEPIAIVSAVCFGVILTSGFVCLLQKCRKPRIKESRSDNDLANMLEKGESS